MSDVQDFFIYDGGTGYQKSGVKLVCIKVPKICCGKTIKVLHHVGFASSVGAGPLSDVCKHMQTYNGIWKAYMIDKIHTSTHGKGCAGLSCKACNNFCPYVDAPNQSDGSFKCYSCRHPME